MAVEIRKTYINDILIELIEKSNDHRMLKTIINLLDNWFKLKDPKNEPNIREKVLLLQKLTYHIENRFASENSLNVQFLELIYFIYSDCDLNTLELTSKLDRAFLAGLRSQNYEIRQKFYKLFDSSVSRSFYDRLLYILSTKAWDSIGHHYWIKQCIELLFQSIESGNVMELVDQKVDLKMELSSNNFQQNQINYLQTSNDLHDDLLGLSGPMLSFGLEALNQLEGNSQSFLNQSMSLQENLNYDVLTIAKDFETNREDSIDKISQILSKFQNDYQSLKNDKFIKSIVQVCHSDSQLTEKLWLKVFPQFWKSLRNDQREILTKEIIPFLAAGTRVNIKEANTSALNTFVQALTLCDPPIIIPHKLMKSLAKVHNIWHRMTLVAEEMMVEFSENKIESEFDSDEDEEDENTSEILSCLSDMYSSMKEEDLWVGLWQANAKYAETNAAMFYEQMGYFEDAQVTYENVMVKFKQDVSNGMDTTKIGAEIQLWEDQWIRCSKELNEWNIVLNYATTNRDKYGLLLTDCAWKVNDFNLMKQSLLRTEQIISKQYNAKVSLYGGFVSLLTQRDNAAAIGKYIELATNASLQEWRNLPHIISNIHIPILQITQQIMELQEACQIHQDLLRKHSLPFHDMKSIFKTWRNRLPIISDDLSYWRDIFTWRHYHYKLIAENANGELCFYNVKFIPMKLFPK
jgi:transformation/transcription domain-associated protein